MLELQKATIFFVLLAKYSKQKTLPNHSNGTYLIDCMVDNIWGNVYVKQVPDGDILFLFGNCQPKFLAQLYQKRWGIEVCFQNLKTRGFNLEDLHLQELSRIRKLIAILSIAYAFCVSLGIYMNPKFNKIKVNSFFRTGMNMIVESFLKLNLLNETCPQSLNYQILVV